MTSYRIISSSCSWCHEINPVERHYCHSCGHEANQPRMFCECYRCQRSGQRGTGIFPLDMADSLSRLSLSDEEMKRIMEQYGFEIDEDDE
jgi:hypothetical protein